MLFNMVNWLRGNIVKDGLHCFFFVFFYLKLCQLSMKLLNAVKSISLMKIIAISADKIFYVPPPA